MKLHFYNDPGHGWLRIKRSLLEELGIADKITTYSYQRGNYAYLEEDLDAGTAIKALHDRGEKVEFVDHFADNPSSIREFDYYRA